MKQHRFNPWIGLGQALAEANEEWRTELMPNFLAEAAEGVAAAYARDPSRDFEKTIEMILAVDLPDLSDAEMHAAKFVVGKIFAANREEARNEQRQAQQSIRDFYDRIGQH